MIDVKTFRWLFVMIACMATITGAAGAETIPTKWGYQFTSRDKPTRKVFGGPISQIQSGVYLVWSKAEYLDTQNSPRGSYTTDVMLIKVSCKPTVYEVVREIRYAADNQVVSDIQFPYGKKSKNYKLMTNGIDLGALPLAESFVQTALLMDEVCIIVYDD